MCVARVCACVCVCGLTSMRPIGFGTGGLVFRERGERVGVLMAGGSEVGVSEADEGGVDLPHTGQRQHDLPSVLGVLLQRVPLQIHRLQGLCVFQLVQVGPVLYLIVVHLRE